MGGCCCSGAPELEPYEPALVETTPYAAYEPAAYPETCTSQKPAVCGSAGVSSSSTGSSSTIDTARRSWFSRRKQPMTRDNKDEKEFDWSKHEKELNDRPLRGYSDLVLPMD